MNRTEMILGICKKVGIKVKAAETISIGRGSAKRVYYKTLKDKCSVNLDSIWCRKEIVEAIHKKICK